MGLVLTILIVWVVVAGMALLLMVALGRAAKRGDEMLWRARLTRVMAPRGRRALERRCRNRRSGDAHAQLPRVGTSDRRRGERREFDRRAEPGWRDASGS
jgi:hypothetical protein